jgi:hypothetical protein
MLHSSGVARAEAGSKYSAADPGESIPAALLCIEESFGIRIPNSEEKRIAS